MSYYFVKAPALNSVVYGKATERIKTGTKNIQREKIARAVFSLTLGLVQYAVFAFALALLLPYMIYFNFRNPDKPFW